MNDLYHYDILNVIRIITNDTVAELVKHLPDAERSQPLRSGGDLWVKGDVSPTETTETLVILHDKDVDFYLTDFAVYYPETGWSYGDGNGPIEDGHTEIFAWMRNEYPDWIKEKLEENENEGPRET